MALTYYALGEHAEAGATGYLTDYYGSAPWVEQMMRHVPHTPEALRETLRRFEAVGVDDLIFDPTIADLMQVDLLAEAVLR